MSTAEGQQLVTIKPEWCDHPEESEHCFIVVEDNGDRLDIIPAIWNGVLVPRETVKRDMLNFI